jgi:hypothetical protein
MEHLTVKQTKAVDTVKQAANRLIVEQRQAYKKIIKRRKEYGSRQIVQQWIDDLNKITGKPVWFQVGDSPLILQDHQRIKSALYKTRDFNRVIEVIGGELVIDYEVGAYKFKSQRYDYSCLEGAELNGKPLLENLPIIQLEGRY